MKADATDEAEMVAEEEGRGGGMWCLLRRAAMEAEEAPLKILIYLQIYGDGGGCGCNGQGGRVGENKRRHTVLPSEDGDVSR